MPFAQKRVLLPGIITITNCGRAITLHNRNTGIKIADELRRAKIFVLDEF